MPRSSAFSTRLFPVLSVKVWVIAGLVRLSVVFPLFPSGLRFHALVLSMVRCRDIVAFVYGHGKKTAKRLPPSGVEPLIVDIHLEQTA